MGKAKQKNHRPDDYLEAQIRHYKKEIKRKDQRIRQLEKDLLLKTPSKEKRTRKEENALCRECGKGEVSLMDIGIRLYAICKLCRHRERIS